MLTRATSGKSLSRYNTVAWQNYGQGVLGTEFTDIAWVQGGKLFVAAGLCVGYALQSSGEAVILERFWIYGEREVFSCAQKIFV